jgi:hypothetical protein
MKRFIGWSLIGLSLLLSAPGAGAAIYDGLASTLIDLPGWSAEPAEGMRMEMGGTVMTSASRIYRKDDAEIEVAVTAGDAVTSLADMGDMKMETDAERVVVAEMDGYRYHGNFGKTDLSGMIVVSLLQDETGGAIFTFSSSGIPEETAVELARKFDWDDMKEEAGKLR